MGISIKPLAPFPSKGQWRHPRQEVHGGFLVTVDPGGGAPRVFLELSDKQVIAFQRQIGYARQMAAWGASEELKRRDALASNPAFDIENLLP